MQTCYSEGSETCAVRKSLNKTARKNRGENVGRDDGNKEEWEDQNKK